MNRQRSNIYRDRAPSCHTAVATSYEYPSAGAESPVVCIVSPNKDAYCETFVRAHIDRLPAKVKVLYPAWFTDDGKPLLSSDLPRRVMRAALRRLAGLGPQYFENSSLKGFLKSEGVDAVLAEYGPTGVAVMHACTEAEVPLVVHFHGYDAYKQKIVERLDEDYRRMFGSAAAIVAVSRDMERQLRMLGAPTEKISYCPCGADTSRFSQGDPGSAPPIFIAVGRFVDKKAPHLTLLAFKKTLDACPEARLIMIGAGQLWEACKQLSRALAIHDAVQFLGPCPHSQVAAGMRTARAFVQHSIRTSDGDSEGTPVSVMEAAAAGLPVVSTRHGGIRDVVLHDQTGFLVDEGDVDGMAERMITLAREPALAAALGRRGRKRICAEFSIEKSINRLWQIIRGAIQARTPQQSPP